jgi:hypothetical protein
MVGQYLWRKELKSKKYDINEGQAQNHEGIKDEHAMEHIEISDTKNTRD